MPITFTVANDPENTAFGYNLGNWSRWDENMAWAYVNMVAEFPKADIEARIRGEYTKALNPVFIFV